MTIDVPYFLTNEKWFRENPKYDMFDDLKREPQFLLTDDAPPEAVKSYNEYIEFSKHSWEFDDEF
nr:MAG TPA: hypothetical protein [Caudoviricetes sp.]